MTDVPNLTDAAARIPSLEALSAPRSPHAPRILLLYGSLRERSYSRS